MAITLVIEDGSGVPGANAYIDVADADLYHRDRFHDAWVGSPSQKRNAILQGAEYIDRLHLYQGIKTHITAEASIQSTEFPRRGMEDDDGFAIDPFTVPQRVIDANAEMALNILVLGGDWNSGVVTGMLTKRRERVGVIENEQVFRTDQSTNYFPRVEALLALYVATKRTGRGSSPLLRG